MRREAIFLLLLLFVSHAQVTTGGGNVTELGFLQSNFSNAWDGLYGQAVLGTEANLTYIVVGGTVTQVDLIAQEPSCPVASQSVHVIAVNATSLTTPLQPGDLAVLDGILTGADNGTTSFTQNGSFELSYGNFSDVPTLFTLANGTTSAYFREGYFNDALGNLVFVADVVNDKPDWNDSTSDYQLILPKSGANYTLSVDSIYSCAMPPNPNPNPNPSVHRLYILPPQMFTASVGSTFDAGFVVRNTGGFSEDGINITLSCPAGFSCGSGYIPYLGVGGQGNVQLPVTAGGTGEFVLTVCAKDADTSTCREFIVSVVAECNTSNDCGAVSFCQNGACKKKENPGESCNDSSQCMSGVCIGKLCGHCVADSDCPSDQTCAGGSCTKVQCSCGKVSGHACASYACCADTDCGRCQICSGNACIDKKFGILIASGAQEGMIEGQSVLVQVLGNDGQGVSDARVFTTDTHTYTDANGYATITVPYDGIVYASADCYQTTGRMFNIMKNCTVVVPPNVSVGEPCPILVLDSHGRPITGATVYVDDTPVTTDSYGVIYHTFNSSGVKTILVQAAGYTTIIASVIVVNGFSCGYPSVAGFLVPNSTSVWRLWFVLSLIAIANFFLLRRIMKETIKKWPITSTLLRLVYAAGPLLIAYMWFGLCFMSNIVVLQFVAGLLIVAGDTFMGLGTSKADGERKKK